MKTQKTFTRYTTFSPTLNRCSAWLVMAALLTLVGQVRAASVDRLTFSQERGWYNAQINVAITTTTAGASIRYTIDGTAPSSTRGTLYAGPVAISASPLRARTDQGSWRRAVR